MLDIVAYVYLHLLLTCFNSNPPIVVLSIFLSSKPLNKAVELEDFDLAHRLKQFLVELIGRKSSMSQLQNGPRHQW